MANEADLVYRLKLRDNSAFEELVAIHQKRVLNICYRFLLSRSDAEDVSQEVFIEVYQSIHLFRAGSKLGTWIYRIAVSKSLDELKRQSRKKRISSIGKMLGLDKAAQFVASDDRPDHALEKNEDFELLMKALNKLHDSQRVALTLSKIEGYTNTEIAEIMQTSLTAVDSLIYRAKQNLKTFLEKKSPEF